MDLHKHFHAHHHDHDHDHDADGNCIHGPDLGSTSAYEKHGVRFQFPASWAITEQSDQGETTISLQSDGTSFWTLMLLQSRPDPDEVLNTVVAAFEQDYDDVDVISSISSLGGLPALGRELDFVCYDLVNSASVRAVQTSELTAMVLFQGTDHELETTRDQLDSITASLQFDDDDSESFDDE